MSPRAPRSSVIRLSWILLLLAISNPAAGDSSPSAAAPPAPHPAGLPASHPADLPTSHPADLPASHPADLAASHHVSVWYQADVLCPRVEAFLAMAMRKSDGVLLESLPDPTAKVTADLRWREDQFVGRLELKRQSGDYLREMTASSCDELASALAFVLGLAVVEEYGGEARRADLSRGTPATAPGPVGAPSPSEMRSDGRSIDVWLNGRAGLRMGISPSVAFLEGAALEVREAAGMAPRVRLGLFRAEPSRKTTREYTAEFSWFGVGVEACPLRLAGSLAFEVRPCVGVQVGSLSTRGSPSTPQGTPESTSLLLAEATAALYLEMQPFSPFSVQLGFGALFPFQHLTFRFDDPYTEVYRPPPVAAAGTFAIAFRIR